MTPHASPSTPSSGRRVRSALAVALAETLTEREWSILTTVNRLRLATGLQLERLHFADLTGKSKSVVRWRVLKRLVDAQALMPLTRRVGGSLRGSAQLTYALDVTGERLLRLRRNLSAGKERIRRPAPIGERFVAHTLATSELYVQLTERSQAEDFTVDTFLAEPAAWWPNGAGGWMKPDAYLSVSSGEITDHWWVEVDLATEAAPTLRGKFLAYIDFVQQGQLGPGDVVPRVLVTVPTDARRDVMATVVAKLPAPADELFAVVLHDEAVGWLTAELSVAADE
ncbi:replication-relaxation family protein [Amycolatopsis sp. lyj-346]|uniref:replication-relaxation family protein n=1 Tax=Amycolatopsis sp. lyj-346 TaxID=2789289 RepID=UPI003979E495